MNLLTKSIRWTQSCPRTGGGLHAVAENSITKSRQTAIIGKLSLDISQISSSRILNSQTSQARRGSCRFLNEN